MDWTLLLPSTWNPVYAIIGLFSEKSQVATKALSDCFILLIIAILIIFITWAAKLTIVSLRETNRYFDLIRKDQNPFIKIESSSLPLFCELNHHLLQIPCRDGSDQMWLRRTVDAIEIFRDATLAPNFTSSRLFRAIPGILTGLGVLGTFVGLQIGIGGLNLTDSNNIESSIVPLIQGCAMAFSTSVWGVMTSLLFGGAEKILEEVATTRIRKLQNKVNSLFPRYVPEEAMAELERTSRGTEDILKGLAVAIGDQMQKAIGRLGSEIKDAVAKATSEGHGPLIEKSTELISSALTSQLEQLRKQIKNMSNEFSDAFSNTSGKLYESIKNFEPSVKTLAEIIDINKQTVADAVIKLNSHSTVMEQMDTAAANIRQAAESFAETKDTMLLSSDRNEKAAQAQSLAAKSNEKAAEQFERVGERLPEIRATLEDAARVIASISNPLSSLKDYLEALPREQKEYQNQINAVANEQTKNLLDLVNTLAEKVGNAAMEFSKVDGLARELSTAAKTLDDASNELAVFGGQVLDASKEQREASQAARAAALAGERTASAIEPLSGEFSRLVGTLQSTSDSVKKGAEASRDSYHQLVILQNQWFEGARVGLTAMKDQLQSIMSAYGQQIEGQTRNLMDQWTSEVAKCLKSYQLQVSQLQNDLDVLQSFLSSKFAR